METLIEKTQLFVDRTYGEDVFKIGMFDGDQKIMLVRYKPSFCEMCSRIHNYENPYIILSNDGKVYFNCRRNPEGRIVGNIQ